MFCFPSILNNESLGETKLFLVGQVKCLINFTTLLQLTDDTACFTFFNSQKSVHVRFCLVSIDLMDKCKHISGCLHLR